MAQYRFTAEYTAMIGQQIVKFAAGHIEADAGLIVKLLAAGAPMTERYLAGTGGTDAGSVVKISAANTGIKAIATTFANTKGPQIAKQAAAVGEYFDVYATGDEVPLYTGLTPGEEYAVSATTAGALAVNSGALTAQWVVGYAKNATTLIYQPAYRSLNEGA